MPQSVQMPCEIVKKQEPFFVPPHTWHPGVITGEPQHLVTVVPALAKGVTVHQRKAKHKIASFLNVFRDDARSGRNHPAGPQVGRHHAKDHLGRKAAGLLEILRRNCLPNAGIRGLRHSFAFLICCPQVPKPIAIFSLNWNCRNKSMSQRLKNKENFLERIGSKRFIWYARLDSNQWPTESESSGGQMGNRWGPVVLWGLDRFAENYRKSPEALRCNASGDFFDSSQIVVCMKR